MPVVSRRAISPPPSSVSAVPRVASLKAPADMTPTVAPPATARRQLAAARQALTDHADALRAALAAMDCHPRELTSVIAAIDRVLDEGDRR